MVSIIFVSPVMREQAIEPFGIEAGHPVAVILSRSLGIVYAAFLLYFMTRDHVKAWFQAAQYEGGDIE